MQGRDYQNGTMMRNGEMKEEIAKRWPSQWIRGPRRQKNVAVELFRNIEGNNQKVECQQQIIEGIQLLVRAKSEQRFLTPLDFLIYQNIQIFPKTESKISDGEVFFICLFVCLFTSALGDSNIQPRLRTTGLGQVYV